MWLNLVLDDSYFYKELSRKFEHAYTFNCNLLQFKGGRFFDKVFSAGAGQLKLHQRWLKIYIFGASLKLSYLRYICILKFRSSLRLVFKTQKLERMIPEAF